MTDQARPKASMVVRLLRWLGFAPPQCTCVWCPRCGNEMCSDQDTQCDVTRESPLVTYTCGNCSLVTVWNFAAPVPLLLTKGLDDVEAD